jgi:hypothetical protein
LNRTIFSGQNNTMNVFGNHDLRHSPSSFEEKISLFDRNFKEEMALGVVPLTF